MEFRVGLWLASADRNCLIRKGQTHHITPKSMDLLVYLAKRCPAVVPKADIFARFGQGHSSPTTRSLAALAKRGVLLERLVSSREFSRLFRNAAIESWRRWSGLTGQTRHQARYRAAGGRGGRASSATARRSRLRSACRTRFRKLFSTALMVLLVGIAAAALYTPVRNSLVWRKSPQVRSIAVLPS